MDIVLTLVVNPGQGARLDAAVDAAAAQAAATDVEPLAPTRAVDIRWQDASLEDARQRLDNIVGCAADIDWCLQQESDTRRKSMIIADMDSTMITVECIDELADFVGKKAEVSKVTEAAMRGELDFEGALRERVALLKGLPVDALETCYRERIEIMPGARTLVRTMKANDAFAALVSGGFTFFTDRVAAEIGFDVNRANRLLIDGDALTGKVAEPICGAAAKLEALNDFCAQQDIPHSEVLAVGDGANDIPMLQGAGLGAAYHAKPKTVAAAGAAVRHGDLSTLLFYQGYSASEFITTD